MERIQVETSEDPKITIENMAASLSLKGWDKSEVRVDADGKKSISLREENDTVWISCERDCVVRVPVGSTLEIHTIGSDALVKAVEGEISIEHVAHNLMLKNAGPATIGKVGGNLTAKRIEGDLEIETAAGNVSISDIEGQASIQSVAGNLSAKRVEGDLEVTSAESNVSLADIDGQASLQHVGGNLGLRGMILGIDAVVSGNADLRFDPDTDGSYDIKADGNISCRVSIDASVAAEMTSGASNIRVKTAEMSETIQEEHFQLTLGDGESSLRLDAGGAVEFHSLPGLVELSSSLEFDVDMDEFHGLAEEISQQVSGQIEAQMESLSEHLAGLTANLGDFSNEKAQAAIRRAESKVAAAQRRIEHKMAAAARRAEQQSRHAQRAMRYQKRGRSTAPAGDPVTDEERRMVLEMIQEKKISVEEGEILLAALEGKSPVGSVEATPAVPPTPPIPPIPPIPPLAPLEDPEMVESPEEPETPEEE
ncbi:MAG: DUF4097 domain-containing protein [Anaerolineae bacterium]|nr:DUF4097 domain-containing protein [Anaerolineae bacterium]